MIKRYSLAIALVVSILLLILNGLAYKYVWYWRYHWSDIPMHFLGGVIVGALVICFTNNQANFWAIVGLSLAVALGWELFEFKFQDFLPVGVVFKALPVWERGLADTISDIFFCVIGTAVMFSWATSRQADDCRVS